MSSKSNPAALVAALALLAVAASGCSRQASDAQSTAAPASQPAAAQATAAAAQATAAPAQPAAATAAAAQAGSAATAAAAAPVAGIASSDGDKTGTKVVVTSLVRGSDTVTLKLLLVNNSGAPLVTYDRFDASPYHGYRTMSNIHLIDTVSKKKYFPIADTDNNCLCSQDVDDIPPGSQTEIWVKFPAPPPSVTKIGIEVPHFIPFDDVPITQ
jgi:hypothetical protein